jgi:bifunctional non-homologous end joining protein LigD
MPTTPRSEEQIREHNRIAASQRPCAIKKHRAASLHYDFRLEYDGVLLSWAIPEGPSYRAGERREAIEMEYHNPKYISSERVIPEGMRGAGPVMHWDEGRWAPLREFDDVRESLRKGCLRFTLNCQKLKGKWMLLRRPGACRGRREPVWDLIKEPDAFARSADAPSILVEAPNSVSTGRTLEEIERDGNERRGKMVSGASLFEI